MASNWSPPNPLLCETAAGLLGLSCPDVWFVGDRLDTDVAGARAAEMTAIRSASSRDVNASDEECITSTWPGLATMIRETAS
ncbi:MAG: HAD hydrolase-like protein [Gemmatimonadaceae bacterium]